VRGGGTKENEHGAVDMLGKTKARSATVPLHMDAVPGAEATGAQHRRHTGRSSDDRGVRLRWGIPHIQ
jgi:hypothetical protein